MAGAPRHPTRTARLIALGPSVALAFGLAALGLLATELISVGSGLLPSAAVAADEQLVAGEDVEVEQRGQRELAHEVAEVVDGIGEAIGLDPTDLADPVLGEDGHRAEQRGGEVEMAVHGGSNA